MKHDVEIYEDRLQHFFPVLAEDAGSAEAMEVEQETGKPNENQEEGAEGGEPEQSSTPGGTSITTDVGNPGEVAGVAIQEEVKGADKSDKSCSLGTSGTVNEEMKDLWKTDENPEKGADDGNPGEGTEVANQEGVNGADKLGTSCTVEKQIEDSGENENKPLEPPSAETQNEPRKRSGL
jgi:hypothetical protein